MAAISRAAGASSGRARTLPRPLRLARLALLIAVAVATFVITTRLAQSRPAAADGFASIRFDDALTNPFAGAATVDADTVVFDDDLSPAQQRNLEQILGRTAIDRTEIGRAHV